MAEQQGFRTSFRGFNREDVMTYVDSLQADFSEREAGLREGLSEANACLAALTEENKQLKTDVAAAEEKAESVRAKAFDHFETMNAQLLMLKKENTRLNTRVAAAAQVGDLLAAIEELRARGTDFLDASGRAGEECLDEMDNVIEALEQTLEQMRSKVGVARSDLNARRDAAGLRLMELEKTLKEGAPVATTVSAAPSAPAQKPTASVMPSAQSVQSVQSAQTAPSPAPTGRLTAQPARPRDGWRRFFDGLLG